MEKLKILVVDDEERMQKLLSDFLKMKDYEVLLAGNGEEAIDLFFKEKSIALIILDVMMPKMDGWTALKTIREHSKVPVIMLTARSEENDELKGFDYGADEYISKPFSPKILVARVEALLRRSGVQKEELLEVGGIVIDEAAHSVTVDGKPIELALRNMSFYSILWKIRELPCPEKRFSTTFGTMIILEMPEPLIPM